MKYHAEDYLTYITEQADRLIAPNYRYRAYTDYESGDSPIVVLIVDRHDCTFMESWNTDVRLTWGRKREIKRNLQALHYTIWRCGI